MNRIALMAVAATAYKAATANALEQQQAGCRDEEEARWQGASFYQAAMGWGFFLLGDCNAAKQCGTIQKKIK